MSSLRVSNLLLTRSSSLSLVLSARAPVVIDLILLFLRDKYSSDPSPLNVWAETSTNWFQFRSSVSRSGSETNTPSTMLVIPFPLRLSCLSAGNPVNVCSRILVTELLFNQGVQPLPGFWLNLVYFVHLYRQLSQLSQGFKGSWSHSLYFIYRKIKTIKTRQPSPDVPCDDS